MRIGLALAALAAALGVAAAQDVPQDIDATIRGAMERTAVEGLAIAVIRDGAVVRTGAYGVTDVEIGSPVTSQTTFQAASLGKVSAAYAVMILAERGVLSLDAPLKDERLRIAKGCAVPTVAQALSHTTGMGNDLRAARFEPDCTPGTDFNYSGQGYAVLATMIEAATGKTAPKAIDELVFAPLGMHLTRYGPPAGESRAHGHASLLSLLVGFAIMRLPLWIAIVIAIGIPVAILGPALFVGRRRGFVAGALTLLLTGAVGASAIFAGLQFNARIEADQPPERIASSLSSNAEDMAKFVAELLSPRMLSVETRDAMLAAHTANEGCIQWGLGIGIDACAGRTTYWQWGSNLGFQGLLVLDPERRAGVVILTNTGGALDAVIPGRGGYAAARDIARAVLDLDGAWQTGGR